MKPTALALLSTLALFAQPRVTNAKLERRSAAAGLEAEFRRLVAGQTAPAWIGYAVPAIPGERNMCCYNSARCCAGCALESGRTSAGTTAPSTGPVRLEGPSSVLVLYRIEQGNVGKIRTFSPDCELDAGGLPFFWLEGVRDRKSVV